MPSLAFRKASICSRSSFSASCTLVVNPQHATRSRLILCWKLPPPSGSSCIGKDSALTWFFRGATVKPTLLMRHRLQYVPVALLVRLIGALPRPLARGFGILLGGAVYHLHRRLRRVGMRNLELAFPEKSAKERRQILRGVYVSLGRLLGEACLFPSYTKENVSRVAVYQGFENFEAAEKRGNGVLFLTGHFGGWEIGSFFDSLQIGRAHV